MVRLFFFSLSVSKSRRLYKVTVPEFALKINVLNEIFDVLICDLNHHRIKECF